MGTLSSIPGLVVRLIVVVKVLDSALSSCTSFCALAENSDREVVPSGRAQADAILDDLFENYDKVKIRPDPEGPPITIRVTLEIDGIMKVPDTTGDFRIDLLLRQNWTDEDLRYNITPKSGYITLPRGYEKELWLPDTKFSSVYNVVGDKGGTFKNTVVRIFPNGDVQCFRRFSVTSKCFGNPSNNPPDSRICTIAIGNFRLTDQDIQYDWGDSGTIIEFSPDALKLLNGFELVAHRQRKYTVSSWAENYSEVACDFFIKRPMGAGDLLGIYFPMASLVLSSWLTFFTRTSSSAGISVGVIMLVSMTTLIRASYLSPNGMRYIPGFYTIGGASFLCVLAPLLCSIISSYLPTDGNEEAVEQQNRCSVLNGNRTEDDENRTESASLKGSQAKKVREDGCSKGKLDDFALILFSIGYVIFNLVYWNHD